MTGALKGVILTANPGEGDSAGWHSGTGMLLPMANVPMIERILDEYERAGVKETLIAAGKDTREAASNCGSGARWNMVLTYHDQPEARSPHEIMKEVAAFTGEAMFLATRGAVLLNAEAYLYAVQRYDENDLRGIRLWERNGEAHGDGDGNDGGDAHGSDGSDGIYLLTPDVCDVINESGGAGNRAYSFGPILDTLAGRGDRVLTMKREDEPYETGTPEAYLESNERLLESATRDAVSPEVMADNFSSPNLVLRPPVALDDTAELERCRIGPGVCIGPRVRIGHGAAIEHSVIMEGADIGDGASISRAIIGKNASIANRSVMHGRADRVTVACPISP
ncbi:MAG: NDP-sugar synthase [Gemmatimonadetes bacterium]|nr:NDP-sugar synthase [Gemmatimonadota bacterium]